MAIMKATNQRLRSPDEDRKSTRLNSSHSQISYAVFCLKKKKISTEAQRYHLSRILGEYEIAICRCVVFLIKRKPPVYDHLHVLDCYLGSGTRLARLCYH